MPIVTYWFNRDCEHYCTRGQRCILMRHEPHKLHICRDPECDCHTEERTGIAFQASRFWHANAVSQNAK
jgi:hypothetical protein